MNSKNLSKAINRMLAILLTAAMVAGSFTVPVKASENELAVESDEEKTADASGNVAEDVTEEETSGDEDTADEAEPEEVIEEAEINVQASIDEPEIIEEGTWDAVMASLNAEDSEKITTVKVEMTASEDTIKGLTTEYNAGTYASSGQINAANTNALTYKVYNTNGSTYMTEGTDYSAANAVITYWYSNDGKEASDETKKWERIFDTDGDGSEVDEIGAVGDYRIAETITTKNGLCRGTGYINFTIKKYNLENPDGTFLTDNSLTINETFKIQWTDTVKGSTTQKIENTIGIADAREPVTSSTIGKPVYNGQDVKKDNIYAIGYVPNLGKKTLKGTKDDSPIEADFADCLTATAGITGFDWTDTSDNTTDSNYKNVTDAILSVSTIKGSDLKKGVGTDAAYLEIDITKLEAFKNYEGIIKVPITIGAASGKLKVNAEKAVWNYDSLAKGDVKTIDVENLITMADGTPLTITGIQTPVTNDGNIFDNVVVKTVNGKKVLECSIDEGRTAKIQTTSTITITPSIDGYTLTSNFDAVTGLNDANGEIKITVNIVGTKPESQTIDITDIVLPSDSVVKTYGDAGLTSAGVVTANLIDSGLNGTKFDAGTVWTATAAFYTAEDNKYFAPAVVASGGGFSVDRKPIRIAPASKTVLQAGVDYKVKITYVNKENSATSTKVVEFEKWTDAFQIKPAVFTDVVTKTADSSINPTGTGFDYTPGGTLMKKSVIDDLKITGITGEDFEFNADGTIACGTVSYINNDKVTSALATGVDLVTGEVLAKWNSNKYAKDTSTNKILTGQTYMLITGTGNYEGSKVYIPFKVKGINPEIKSGRQDKYDRTPTVIAKEGAQDNDGDVVISIDSDIYEVTLSDGKTKKDAAVKEWKFKDTIDNTWYTGHAYIKKDSLKIEGDAETGFKIVFKTTANLTAAVSPIKFEIRPTFADANCTVNGTNQDIALYAVVTADKNVKTLELREKTIEDHFKYGTLVSELAGVKLSDAASYPAVYLNGTAMESNGTSKQYGKNGEWTIGTTPVYYRLASELTSSQIAGLSLANPMVEGTDFVKDGDGRVFYKVGTALTKMCDAVNTTTPDAGTYLLRWTVTASTSGTSVNGTSVTDTYQFAGNNKDAYVNTIFTIDPLSLGGKVGSTTTDVWVPATWTKDTHWYAFTTAEMDRLYKYFGTQAGIAKMAGGNEALIHTPSTKVNVDTTNADFSYDIVDSDSDGDADDIEITIKGKGNLTGQKVVKLIDAIVPAVITDVKLASYDYPWTGTGVKPELASFKASVNFGGKASDGDFPGTEGSASTRTYYAWDLNKTDYTLTYENNVNPNEYLFSESKTYAKGDICIKPADGKLYAFTAAHSAGTWTTDVEKVTTTFAVSTGYTVGKVLLYGGGVYKVTTDYDGSETAWDPAKAKLYGAKADIEAVPTATLTINNKTDYNFDDDPEGGSAETSVGFRIAPKKLNLTGATVEAPVYTSAVAATGKADETKTAKKLTLPNTFKIGETEYTVKGWSAITAHGTNTVTLNAAPTISNGFDVAWSTGLSDSNADFGTIMEYELTPELANYTVDDAGPAYIVAKLVLTKTTGTLVTLSGSWAPVSVEFANDDVSLRTVGSNTFKNPKATDISGAAQDEVKYDFTFYKYDEVAGGYVKLDKAKGETPVNVGKYRAEASIKNTDRFTGSPITADFEITPLELKVGSGGNVDRLKLAKSEVTYNGEAQKPDSTMVVTFKNWVDSDEVRTLPLVGGTDYDVEVRSPGSLTNAGSVMIDAITKAGTNYTVETSTGVPYAEYTIKKADASITLGEKEVLVNTDGSGGNGVVALADLSYTKDGFYGNDTVTSCTIKKGTMDGTEFVPDDGTDGALNTFTTPANVGKSAYYRVTNAVNNNYNITVNGYGKLTVVSELTKKPATATVKFYTDSTYAEEVSGSAVYKGSAFAYKVEAKDESGNTVPGSEYMVKESGSKVNVGTFKAEVSSNEGSNYEVTGEGSLAITPASLGMPVLADKKALTKDYKEGDKVDLAYLGIDSAVLTPVSGETAGTPVITITDESGAPADADKVLNKTGVYDVTVSVPVTSGSMDVSANYSDTTRTLKLTVMDKEPEVITASYKVSVGGKNVTGGGNVKYTGEVLPLTVEVMNGSDALKEGTDYSTSLEYKSGSEWQSSELIKDTGDYRVKITCISTDYKFDDKTVTFTVKEGSDVDPGTPVEEPSEYEKPGEEDYPSFDEGGEISVTGVITKKCTYNGKPQEPTVKVTGTGTDGKKLVAGTDYKVTYANNINATGEEKAIAIISGIGKYAGSKEVEFVIAPKKLGGTVVAGAVEKPEEGKPSAEEIEGAISVYDGTKLLNYGDDYEIAESSIAEGKGKYDFVITYKGNYTGSKKASVKMAVENDLALCDVEITFGGEDEATYTGKAFTVKNGNMSIKVTDPEGKEVTATAYSVTYKNNTNVGVGTVTLKGKKPYAGSKVVRFTINRNEDDDSIIKADSITVNNGKAMTYTGKLLKPSVKVQAMVNGKMKNLSKNKDYVVYYSSELNASTDTSTGCVIIRPIGNYEGQDDVVKGFTINKADFKKTSIKKNSSKQSGIYFNGKKLVADKDFNAKLVSVDSKGKYTVTVKVATDSRNFTGAAEKTIKGTKAQIDWQQLFGVEKPEEIPE